MATDKKGRSVEFFNTVFSGHGCAGAYSDNGKEYKSKLCYIKGVKCVAQEAYMGGVVVSIHPNEKGAKRKKGEAIGVTKPLI